MKHQRKNHLILIFDPEQIWAGDIELTLQLHGLHQVHCFADPTHFLHFLKKEEPSLIIIRPQERLPDKILLIDKIKTITPSTSILLFITPEERHDMLQYVTGQFSGFVDFPLDPIRLISTCYHALELFELRQENQLLFLRGHRLQNQPLNKNFQTFITQNSSLIEELKFAQVLTSNQKPVLISGEVGVGKTKLGLLIHNSNGIETEAITFDAAKKARKIPPQLYKNQKLLIQNIDQLDLSEQKKLLRHLQVKSNPSRVIATTCKNLKKRSHSGEFNRKLYLILKAQEIEIPPLRERPEDIRSLAIYFTAELSKKNMRKTLNLPKNFDLYTQNYAFPGNVAELKEIIKVTYHLSKGNYLLLRPIKQQIKSAPSRDYSLQKKFTLNSLNLKSARKGVITEALKRSNNNQTAASQMLDISRQALNQYLNPATKKDPKKK